MVTQGALPVAILVLLTVNRKLTVRPNFFLCLVTLLLFETVIGALAPEHFGTIYRTFRLAEFIAALWLLTPWWGRNDLILVRAHLTCLSVLLISAVLGIVVAPGKAFTEGRLPGHHLDHPADAGRALCRDRHRARDHALVRRGACAAGRPLSSRWPTAS